MGHKAVYISTDHTGLYEKYGYEFFKTAKSIDGEENKHTAKFQTNCTKNRSSKK